MKNIQSKNRIYGIIGMVGLFLIGGIVGYILNGSDHINRSTMTQYQCHELANKIVNAANNNQPDLIEQLNKVYSENCLNRVFEEPKPQPKVEEKKLPQENCAAVEELLKQNLSDENDTSPWAHYDNGKMYERIAMQGCEKNREKYLTLSQREYQIAKALDTEGEIDFTKDSEGSLDTTCEKIEYVLLKQLNCRKEGTKTCKYDEGAHINDAKIYANLSERGCPGNSEKYKALAKQELEIARAMTDDDIEHRNQESVEIVETYKRLQMQAEAEKMIEKAKKLTNPAIDFIIQLEKIIEE